MSTSNYESLFRQSADSWEQVTASVVSLMFERAEQNGYRISAFKNWLLKQPLTSYTRSRVESIYQDFKN